MKNPQPKESKKPKTAADKGKRYRCCVCKKRAPRKVTHVPYYCSERCRNERQAAEQEGTEPC